MRKSRVQRIWKNAVVFYLGGMFYCTVELLWRQWTHGSMFLPVSYTHLDVYKRQSVC